MKELSITLFGQLTDVFHTSEIKVPQAESSEKLLEYLYDRWPQLRGKTFLIAVDKKIVRENTRLTERSMVALLPPFSGG